jgi:predicted AAA+ superfamily ATPase
MIKRLVEDQISELFAIKKAIIIYGARQVGKTTLCKLLTSNHSKDTIVFNGDEPDVRSLFENAGSVKLKNMIGSHQFVIIDEAQKIPEIGNIVKLISDNLAVQLIVTGSSSFDIANLTKEAMTGRKIDFNLYPLCFSELVNDTGLLNEKRMLHHRLIYGAYPEIVKHTDNAKVLLKSLTSSYLYRDVLSLENIKKPDLVERLAKALALQVGSEVSYFELSRLLGADKATIEKYIDILEKSFIIFRLNSFSKNIRNELKKSKKIYFWDNGVRNAVIGNFTDILRRTDYGQLWENYLISERLKLNSYLNKDTFSYFWRTTQQQEIDYVEVENNEIFAFEFKWNEHKKVKIPTSFSKAYQPKELMVVSPKNYEEFLLTSQS